MELCNGGVDISSVRFRVFRHWKTLSKDETILRDFSVSPFSTSVTRDVASMTAENLSGRFHFDTRLRMAEKFFRVKKVAPREIHQLSGNSWSEKAKIYGIKVGDGDLPVVHRYQPINNKSTVEKLKKWAKKCKWKPPVAMLVISMIQVSS